MKLLAFIIIFILISLLFWGIRLYRFEKLMTFYSDQALFLEDISAMIRDKKPRLIGDIVNSKTVSGLNFYSGPNFYYYITPIVLVAHWDIVLMTKIFMVTWWLVGIGLLLWIRQYFGNFAGLSTYLLYTTFPYYLNYNRFLWNPCILPLIGLFYFTILLKLFKHSTTSKWLLFGLITGVGVGTHYAAALWLLIAFCVWIFGLIKKKWQYLAGLWFLLGTTIGNLPFLIFELRHNFFNLRIMIKFLSTSRSNFNIFDLAIALLPIMFFILGLLIYKLEKFNRFNAWFFVFIMTAVFLISINWKQQSGLGIPRGWDILKQKAVVNLICHSNTPPFEVAATIGGDTLATDLRWLLKRQGCQPMGYDQYPNAQTLYLIAPQSRLPEKENVWEVRSFRPFTIEEKIDLQDGIWLYKLVK
jgi:hypothetical protein